MELFKLWGSIMIQDKDAQESLSKTEKKAEGLGSKLMNVAATAGKVGMAIGGMATVAGGALAALTGKALETASEINKFSEVTGHSTEAFQRMDHVMKNFGYSMEQASGDIAALAEKALDASNNVGEGAELFGLLGVTVTDTSGKLKSQEQIFQETITALQGMENVTERNAIASALLSTTGEELVPVLNMTSQELANMKANANVISEDDLSKAEQFKQGWENAKNTLSTVVTTIGIQLMPMFQGLLDWVQANMPQIQATAELVFNAVNEGIGTVVGWIGTLIDWLKNWYSDNEATLTSIKEAYIAYFTALFDMYKAFFDFVMDIWEKYGEDIMNHLNNVFDIVQAIFKTAFDLIMDIFKVFTALFKGDWEGLWNAFESLVSNALENIKSIISAAFNTVWDNAKLIFGGVKDTILGIWDDIYGGIRGSINAIIGAMNAMIRGINKISFNVPDWVPLIGGNSWGFNLPKIPSYANGTDFHPGGLALVGERGPELVNMPRGSSVNTANETESLLQALVQNSQREIVFAIDGHEFVRATYDIFTDKMYRDIKVRSRAMGLNW